MLTEETFEELSKIDSKIQKLTSEIKGLMGMSYMIQEKRNALKDEIQELEKQKQVIKMLF